MIQKQIQAEHAQLNQYVFPIQQSCGWMPKRQITSKHFTSIVRWMIMIYNSVFPILVQETAQFLQAAGISKAQETPRVTVPPVGCFGMGCAGDRYTRDDLLWVNPSRQLRPHSCLITLPKSDGERPGRAKVRKFMDWDKDSFIGTAKAMHATKAK